MKKIIFVLVFSFLVTACETIPTVDQISDTTSQAIDNVVQTYENTDISGAASKAIESATETYNETGISESLASENIQNTAQNILNITLLDNFFQLPNNTQEARIKREGKLIRAAAGIWLDTKKGRDNKTYPRQTIQYDSRIEKIIQSRIGTMKQGDILSWKHPYWGSLWVYGVTRSYSGRGERCLNFQIGTNERIMSIFNGVTACLNPDTGIFEPQEVRCTDLLPVEPIGNFPASRLPGERIDTWNI